MYGTHAKRVLALAQTRSLARITLALGYIDASASIQIMAMSQPQIPTPSIPTTPSPTHHPSPIRPPPPRGLTTSFSTLSTSTPSHQHQEHKNNTAYVVKSLLAGAVAGSTAKTVTAPLGECDAHAGTCVCVCVLVHVRMYMRTRMCICSWLHAIIGVHCVVQHSLSMGCCCLMAHTVCSSSACTQIV